MTNCLSTTPMHCTSSCIPTRHVKGHAAREESSAPGTSCGRRSMVSGHPYQRVDGDVSLTTNAPRVEAKLKDLRRGAPQPRHGVHTSFTKDNRCAILLFDARVTASTVVPFPCLPTCSCLRWDATDGMFSGMINDAFWTRSR